MKQLLAQLDRKYKGLKHRIFGSLQSAGIDGYAPRRYANAVKEARRAEKGSCDRRYAERRSASARPGSRYARRRNAYAELEH